MNLPRWPSQLFEAFFEGLVLGAIIWFIVRKLKEKRNLADGTILGSYIFGYRCYYGMGSVHAWRFTQRIAGMVLGGLGLVLTVVMAVLSMGFGSMDVNAMVWRTVWCLVWEAVLSLLATLAINGLAMYWFDRKGELRRRPRKKA